VGEDLSSWEKEKKKGGDLSKKGTEGEEVTETYLFPHGKEGKKIPVSY